MTSIAKLKDRARKYEQKEDWEAAIKAYQEVLEKEEGADELELELGLYNRIGDLHLRLGHTDDAVSYYEAAADKYAESGFINNAIALCNKALRHRPDRPTVYLKLSRLCAEQGFQTDARRWILEYAERQMKAGQSNEALTALEDFADLSDDPEVRATLAQQLVAHDRHDEAIDELRKAYHSLRREGDDAAAQALAERAAAIDPSVDLASEPVPESPAPAAGGLEEADSGELAIEPTAAAEPETAPEPDGTMEGLETRADAVAPEEAGGGIEGLEGLESTGAEVDAGAEAGEELSGLEVSYAEQEPPASPADAEEELLGGLETFGAGEAESDEAADEADGADGADEAEWVEDEAEEEEAEPLPMLDTGLDELEAEDEEAEEGEPLPLLDTGFDEEPEEETSGAGEPGEPEEAGAVDEFDMSAFEAEAGTAEPWEESSDEEDALPALDLSGAGAEEPEAEPEPAVPPAADAMDLDLGAFDLGLDDGAGAEPAVVPEDLDADAVLQRGRELVSRGLTGEALRELRLLSGSQAGPETFREALGVVNEVIRHDPNDLAALQRRVEYSARAGDQDLLVDAYTDLADALARLGAETKAQAMYGRVLDLDPENEVAREALGVAPGSGEDEAVIDLDAVLREMDPDEMDEAAGGPGDAEDPSMAAMLSQFKAKVIEPVSPDEAGDHYDLGLAFKEMGLIDEAISEFQTALMGGTERLKVYEELGQCFIQKGQYNVALKVFNRALQVPHNDESELLGVYYHLGQCHEELGQRADAREAYGKVLAIDGSFADVPDRMARL